jgi:hypothetical protein
MIRRDRDVLWGPEKALAMIVLAIVGCVGGCVLGPRFKVLILVPAVVFGLTIAAAAGVAHGDGAWPIAWKMVVTATSLQFGYFAGLSVQLMIAVVSAPAFAWLERAAGIDEESFT